MYLNTSIKVYRHKNIFRNKQKRKRDREINQIMIVLRKTDKESDKKRE